MTESTSLASWEVSLARHRHLLNEHVALWQSISDQHAEKSDEGNLARRCLENTTAMIQQCDKLASLTGPATTQHRPNGTSSPKRSLLDTKEDGTQPRKKRKGSDIRSNTEHTVPESTANDLRAPIVDVSGLFVIDTNPTPVNLDAVTEQQPRKKAKRQHSPEEPKISEGQSPVTESLSAIHEKQPPQKRNKRAHDAQQNGDAGQTGRTEPATDEELEQKVALRLKQKDEKRAQKLNKKRKRESEASVESLADADATTHTHQAVSDSANSNLLEHLHVPLKPRSANKALLKAQLAEARKTEPNLSMKAMKERNTKNRKKKSQMELRGDGQNTDSGGRSQQKSARGASDGRVLNEGGAIDGKKQQQQEKPKRKRMKQA